MHLSMALEALVSGAGECWDNVKTSSNQTEVFVAVLNIRKSISAMHRTKQMLDNELCHIAKHQITNGETGPASLQKKRNSALA